MYFLSVNKGYIAYPGSPGIVGKYLNCDHVQEFLEKKNLNFFFVPENS